MEQRETEISDAPPSETRTVSGARVVIALLVVIASTVAGLVWYKHQPQSLPPALSTETGIMLLIPAGPFSYGPYKTEGVAPAFYMDRIEVTNASWMHFSGATNRPLPADFPRERPGDPVVNITIDDAAAFAKWAGKRLPDALEWEKGFRGTDGRSYPWGSEAISARANVSDSPQGAHRVVPADSLQEGASPYNLLHMAGNVAEFTRTLSSEPDSRHGQEGRYLVKGGSFETPLESALAWKSVTVSERFRSMTTGFRCVKDPPRH